MCDWHRILEGRHGRTETAKTEGNKPQNSPPKQQMEHSNEPKGRGEIPWVAIIGLIGTLGVAYIGYITAVSPYLITLQATQTAEARLTQMASSVTAVANAAVTASAPGGTSPTANTANMMPISASATAALSSATPPPTPISSPTSAPTAAPASQVIANFEQGIGDWQYAPLGDGNWGRNETALSVKASAEAGQEPGALWGDFNFGNAQDKDPRATYYVEFATQPQNWTTYEQLHFRAKFLRTTRGVIKATIVVRTGANECYHEHSAFQDVGRSWTTLTFELHKNSFKNCEGQTNVLLANRDHVVGVAVVVIPNPDQDTFAGAVLVDDVRLDDVP